MGHLRRLRRALGRVQLSSGWLGVTGVLSIATGILLVAWPGIGAVSLAIVVGAYLAAYGVVLLVSAAKAPRGQRVAEPLTGA